MEVLYQTLAARILPICKVNLKQKPLLYKNAVVINVTPK